MAQREWRLLRELGVAGLPTAEVIGVVIERDPQSGADGLLITRNIDYSVPYRVLLSGRGLHIPYLGERLLDALAGLLVQAASRRVLLGRLLVVEHVVPTRRRALIAYIIDVETGDATPPCPTGNGDTI